MQPLNHSYSSENQLDFSSALMRATSTEPFSAIDHLQEDFDHIRVNQNRADNNVRENRNISSILTNIRDDVSTPAHAEKKSGRNNTSKKIAADTKPSASVRPGIIDETTASAVFQQPHESQNNFFHDDDKLVKKSRLSLWQPLALSLALTITVIMGYNLFQLHTQSNELQLTLSRYEEKINDLSKGQNSTALDSPYINDELTHLKQQIAAIRSDLTDYDSQIKQSDIIDIRPKLEEINTLQRDIGEMQSLIEATRNELANLSLSNATTESSLTEANQSNSISTTRWSVNLASLSSKEQVQIGLSMLEKSGREPVVREIEVNGAMVYRLSVEGFSSHDEALEFVSTAKKKYGFDGGWVRRS